MPRPTLGPNKSARTAVAIVPPPSLWPAIQPLRRAFDPAHPRWPPHLNLLFPFVPLSANPDTGDHAHLPATLERISAALQSCAAASIQSAPSCGDGLPIQLAQASTFFQRKVAIVHAQPIATAHASLLPVHAALLRAFPQCSDTADHAGGFHPHLTLAKVPWNATQPRQTQDNLDMVLDAAAKAVREHHAATGTLEWVAHGVYVLERLDSDPFTFVGYVGFDGTVQDHDPYGLLGTTYSPDADLNAPLTAGPHQDKAHEVVQIAEPKDYCSVLNKAPTDAERRALLTRPWRTYPFVDSPAELASDTYDQTWVVLPTYRFDFDQQAWVPVPRTDLELPRPPPPHDEDAFTIVSYNVLNSVSPNAHARHTRLLAQLQRETTRHNVTVIALQELTPTFLDMLLAQPWVQSDWCVSHTSEFATPIFPSMGAQGFLVRAHLPFAHLHMRLTGKKAHCVAHIPALHAWIANVHLTSNHSTNRDPKDKRVAQMDPVGQLMERHARGGLAVVVGDFNSDDHAEDAMLIGRFGLVDAASELGARLNTFDPTCNPLALAAATNKEDPHAYDRVVYRGKDGAGGWHVKEMRMLGQCPEDEPGLDIGLDDQDQLLKQGWPVSDHFGVVAHFAHASHPHAVRPAEPVDSLVSNHDIHSRLAALHNYESVAERSLRSKALDLLTHHLNHLDRMPPLAIPHLLPVGSVRLGLHSPQSDTDLLCLVTTSPALFADAIERTACPTGLRLMRVIRDATVPTAQFMACDRVHMDVQYVSPSTAFLTRAGELLANPDKGVLTAAPSENAQQLEWPEEKKSVTAGLLSVRDAASAAALLTPAAKLAFRVLRAWAQDEGLYAGRVGYLSGAALVVLVLRVIHMHPHVAHSAAAIVKLFFRDFAQFPFASVAVTMGGAPTAPVRAPLIIESINKPRVNITRHATAATRGVLVTALRAMQHVEDPAAKILGLDVPPGHRTCRVLEPGWRRFLFEYPTYIDVALGWAGADDQQCETTHMQGKRAWRLAVGTVRWNQVLARVDRVIEAHQAALLQDSGLSQEQLDDDNSRPPPARAQEVPSITVHVWPIAWQSKEVSRLPDASMNKLSDVDAHYLVGIRGVEPGTMLMKRIIAEMEAAVRPPEVDEVKGAAGSSLSPGATRQAWWSYVTCMSHVDAVALDLMPVDREWADPGPTTSDPAQLLDGNVAQDDAVLALAPCGSEAANAPALPSDLPPGSLTAETTSNKQRKSSSKSKGKAPSQAKNGGKLRPSQDVMHRLLWDSDTYDAADYCVGYIDRFLGIKERPLLAFRSDDEADPDWVPLHRIVHFRRISDGVKVWDREKKVDLVFGAK